MLALLRRPHPRPPRPLLGAVFGVVSNVAALNSTTFFGGSKRIRLWK